MSHYSQDTQKKIKIHRLSKLLEKFNISGIEDYLFQAEDKTYLQLESVFLSRALFLACNFASTTNSTTNETRTQLVKEALDLGANLHESADYILRAVLPAGYLDVIETFVEYGYVFNESNFLNAEFFSQAARLGHVHILEYFVSKGIDPMINNQSAFKNACEHGRLEAVQYFLDLGGSVDVLFEYADESLEKFVQYKRLELNLPGKKDFGGSIKI